MKENQSAMDVLLSQRFLPEAGGSIRWMYEVYRRWPRPVEVITHDYYHAPPNTPDMPEVPKPANGRDHVTDTNLKMDRRDIFIRDWGLESAGRLLRYWRMTRAVHERLRKYERVNVHCTHAVPEVVSLIPLRWRYGRRLRVICYAHGEEVTACESSRQLRLLMSRAHRVVDLMIANSRYTANLLRGHLPSEKVHVVNPGVELEQFAGAEQAGVEWREQNNLAGSLVVLTVGRLDPRKNHAAVIEAVARLSGRFKELVYVVAGQGRQMQALREQAKRLGVGERVIFAGVVDGQTKLAMFGGCDVFAMPAIQDGTDVEGFGIVFVEAGACGKASIAGKAGGQPEAVVHERTGLVVDGRDLQAVTGGLERLLSDAELRRRMGRAARERAAELDWSRIVEQTVQLVEEIR